MKFISTKDWTTKDYGKNAVMALIAGGVAAQLNTGFFFVPIIADIIILTGFILGIFWFYRVTRVEPKEPINI